MIDFQDINNIENMCLYIDVVNNQATEYFQDIVIAASSATTAVFAVLMFLLTRSINKSTDKHNAEVERLYKDLTYALIAVAGKGYEKEGMTMYETIKKEMEEKSKKLENNS